MRHRLTKRDMKVINFLNQNQSLISSSEQLCKLFFSENSKSEESARVITRRRMNALVEHGEVNVYCRGLGLSNLYYTTKRRSLPKNINHVLMMTEALVKLKESGIYFDTKNVFTEVSIKDIRCDFIIREAEYGGIPVSIVIEVENTKSISQDKLDILQQIKKERKQGLHLDVLQNSVMILIVQDKELQPEQKQKFFYTDTEFSNITCIRNAIQRVILQLEK